MRKPRPRGGRKKKSGKGDGKGAQQPQRPKWLDDWKEGKEEKEDAAPSWSRKSYASVVSSSKSEPEGKEEEEESDKEEDAGMTEAAEVPAPSSPGGASPKRKPKGSGVTFNFGSGTGSSTSPSKGRGGGMSTLEAQLSALLPALMEMVDAHTRA